MENSNRISLVLATLTVCLTQYVNANAIQPLNFNCAPCILYNGFYCFDDPWVVNFQADLCFENYVDVVSCNGNFSNNITDCYGQIILPYQ